MRKRKKLTDTIAWGPTGQAVYERTYSRVKADGSRETWSETVARVVKGNLALVYGHDEEQWSHDVHAEADALFDALYSFEVLPAGRHLWASGVKGRQYLFNCHVAGWTSLADHVEFTLMRLAEGGGVGANYSNRFLKPLGAPRSPVKVHVVCDPSHPDFDALKDTGRLSKDYDSNWPGAFEIEDTREGWAAAIIDLIETAYRTDVKHEDRVYDVSRLRWAGARLKTMGGTASGPEPLAKALHDIGGILTDAIARIAQAAPRKYLDGFGNPVGSAVEWAKQHLTSDEAMRIDHAIAEAIVAGGTRRSARMAIKHWSDPDVFDFINCKADHQSHWTTNISVEIDDEFNALLRSKPDPNPAIACPVRKARAVLKAIVTGMLTNGEPGIWNSSLSNVGEPNEVIATNPCGEIALEAWENCNLGHVNMDAFVDDDGTVDMPRLEKAHRLMTRFLMRATYGDVVDDKQAATLARNRRIGVGHFGIQGYIVKQGLKFSEVPIQEALRGHPGNLRSDLEHLAIVVDKEAVKYAHELRIPVPVKKRCLAPTGSIALLPGVTPSLQPVYARHGLRRVMFSNVDPAQRAQVERYRSEGMAVEPSIYAANTDVVTFLYEDSLVAEVKAMGLSADLVESQDEISLRDMLAMQALYQESWADNAISFTVNVPAEPHQAAMMAEGYEFIPEPSDRRVREVVEALTEFLPKLKGTTLMLDGSRPQAPFERITEARYAELLSLGTQVTIGDGYDEECASGACPIK